MFLFEGWRPRAQADDAYISYRYARNLAAGHGLTFNPGERPVEGFSNPLWTVLVASGMAVGISAPKVGHFLGLMCGVWTLLATYMYACAGVSASVRWVAALAPFLVVSSEAFPIWTISGMETPLFAATCVSALGFAARGYLGGAVVMCALAALTRPEGPLLAIVILCGALLRSLFSTPRARSVAQVVGWACLYACMLLAVTAGRLWYYGVPLPNTYYAKVGNFPWWVGVGYLESFLLSGPVPLFVAAAVSLGKERLGWEGGCWAALMAAYIVWVGGDVFPGHRFWLPLIPVVAAPCASAPVSS